MTKTENMFDLYTKGSTLQQIGDLYGISRQRVNQLIKKYEKIKRNYYTLNELIKITNASIFKIRKFTKNKRFSAEEVAKIKQLLKNDFKTCHLCDKKISQHSKYCSDCAKEGRALQRLNSINKLPTLQNTHNFTHEALKKLTNISPGKTYISLK